MGGWPYPAVRHVDWSADCSVIRTMCSAYEILYFSPRTGKQVVQNQRDTEWVRQPLLLYPCVSTYIRFMCADIIHDSYRSVVWSNNETFNIIWPCFTQ